MRYDPAMRTFVLIVVALILTGAGSTAWANEPPALAKARTLYNAGDFDGAIDAASVARKDEAWADAAALVVARSHLELYRDASGCRGSVGRARRARRRPRRRRSCPAIRSI